MESTNKLGCLPTSCDTKLVEVCDLERKGERWLEESGTESSTRLGLMAWVFK